MFLPDNFLYFIILFFIAIFGGTYLLFSYYRDRLLLANALIFYLCGVRACTEFILPSIDSFEIATQIASFHSLIGIIFPLFKCYCIWFYVRPFIGKSYEKAINQLFFWLFLIIPTGVKSIFLVRRQVYLFYPEKIDDYWQFFMNTDFEYFNYFFLHNYMQELVIIGLFLFSIYRDSKFRLRKSFLLFLFILFPYLYFRFFEPGQNQTTIPNIAGLFLLHTIIISWFISDYRIFKDSFKELANDVLNSVSDLVIFSDLKQNIVNLNQKAEAFFGRMEHKTISTLFEDKGLLSIDTIKGKLGDLRGGVEQSIELNLFNAEQQERILTLKAAPFKKNNKLIGYTWLLTDITQLRANEKELRSLNATKDQLFGIISHDLRKPALAFRGISKKVNYLLQEGQYKRLLQLGESLESAAINLNKLLDNLLKWALSQKDGLKIKSKPHEIQPIIDDILQLFAKVILEKEITFEVDIPPNTAIMGDRDITATIMRNLIDNAIKFTPSGETIQFSANTIKDEVLCALQDNGIGMTPEQIDKIFQLDKRKSKQGTKGEKGVGLGMVLVKELVDAQNGNINISSEPNKGTLIEVTMPTV